MRARRSTTRSATGSIRTVAGARARGAAHRRRQRLVLVVRGRPFVGARRRVRRPVPPAPAERLPPAARSRFPTSSSSATSRRSRPPPIRDRADGAAVADARRRGDQLLRVAGRRDARGPARSPAPCTRPTGVRRSSRLVHFGFDHERLFVRVDGRVAGRRPAGRRARALAEVLQPERRPLLGPAAAGPRSPARSGIGSRRSRTGVERGPAESRSPRARSSSWRCRSPTSGSAPAQPVAFFVAVFDDSGRRARAAPGAPADRAADAGRAVRSAELDAPRSQSGPQRESVTRSGSLRA